MRRTDRELTAQQAWEIVDGCSDCVLSMVAPDGTPYAVPLNFAREDDRLYFHCAMTGHKLDCLRQNSRVCITCVADAPSIDQPRLTTRYASAILFGTAEEVQQADEKLHALRLLCQRLAPENPEGQGDFQDCIRQTAVWRITVLQISGKVNPGT